MSKIQYTVIAEKQMRKLPPDIRTRLKSRISEYAETGKGDVKTMQGAPVSRLRIGDYRVIFRRDPETISVLRVGHRREIYR